MGKIELVIYDCDGVLFDSFEANRHLYSDIVKAVGREPLSEEEIKYCHTHTVYDSIHFLFRERPELEEEALKILKKIELTSYIAYLKVEPFLFETLSLLKEKNIKRAINTNRTTTMKAIMERFNLHPFFDMVVTALDVKKPKPDPESIKLILDTLRVKKERALFVGDSEIDRIAALSSGIKFVAYKNKEIAIDGVIENHLDILKFLLDY